MHDLRILTDLTQLNISFFRNTARAIFENSKIASEILGIEEDLIEGLGDIWTLINLGIPINPEMFGNFCKKWVELYKNSSISWFWITPTLHKILYHGQSVIEHFPIPIGWLSEEAAEASNKTFKRFRLEHACKSSPERTLGDIFKGHIAKTSKNRV